MSESLKICKLTGTDNSICLPKNNDVWYKGTYNLITWSIMYPYYNIPKSPTLSIYFYYQENYQYHHTLNFTNININDGYHVIYINDSFFPNNNENNKKWQYMVIIVGNSTNPDKEINNLFTNFPKIDFYIVQNTSVLPSSTIYSQSPTISSIYTNTETSINVNENINKKFETWKIIVIIICFILFILISTVVFLNYRKKRKFFKNIFKNKKSFENIEIIYSKPDQKNSKNNIIYQKPNQI